MAGLEERVALQPNQQLPVKSTRLAVRLARSTKTEACSYSRVYVHVPALRVGGPLGEPRAHFACG